MSNIRQLEEKVVATEIILMRWSDRMDLLALANTRGEVSLHRLTWQRVWCLLPDKESSTVVDMTWRPDGKIIAVGYNCGKVVLVEVEKKNILREIDIEGGITCISWQQDKSSTTTSDNDPILDNSADKKDVGDSSKFLQDLPSLSSEFPSATKSPVENLVDLNFVRNQNNLNILIIGTKTGVLHVSIFGLFTCALVDISQHLNKKCSIVNVHMSENLSTLYILSCDDNNLIDISLLDTSILSSHSKEFFSMGLKHGHLVSLLAYLDSTMSSITEAWESILLEMDSKLSKYASNVPEGTVTADFLDLLMFGIPSDEMEEFLMQDLTDKGLKKLGHSIELSYSNIQKLLLKHLNKVGQNITYYLAELRGMARFTYRNKNLGLSEKTITAAIMANGAFLVKGVEVNQVINHSMTNYRAFFRWLYVVILRLMGEQIPPEIPKMAQHDLAYITEFLQNFDSMGNNSSGQKGRFNLERLGQYLLDAPLTVLSKNDGNIWHNFLEENEGIAEHKSVIKHFESMSLVQQHKHLVKSVNNIFVEPNDFIASNFKFAASFSCVNVSDVGNLCFSQLNCNESITFLVLMDRESLVEGVYFFELNHLNNFTPKGDNFPVRNYSLEISESNYQEIQNESLGVRGGSLTVKGAFLYSSRIPEILLSSQCKILDVKFYSPSHMSILFEECSESRSSYLCQVPLAFIRSNLIQIEMPEALTSQGDSKLDICQIPGNITKQIEGMSALKLEVTSSRHVGVVLSDNQRKVQLFEMEAEEEEDELDDTYITANSTRDTESMAHSLISAE